MKKILVLDIPKDAQLKLAKLVIELELWTLFSYESESAFFGPKMLCVYICIYDRTQEIFDTKLAKLKSSFPNEIKQTFDV